MTTYNRIAILKPCLTSFSKTKFPEKTRLIITDDGSQDPLIIEALRDFINNPPHNLEVEVRIRSTNIGCDASVVESITHAFAQTSDDWIVIQDSDGFFHSEWFITLMKFKTILDTHYSKYALSVWNNTVHPDKAPTLDYRLVEKESIAGFNLLIHREIFKGVHIKEWDWSYVDQCKRHNAPMFTTRESWVHHIGLYGTHTTNMVNHTIDFVKED